MKEDNRFKSTAPPDRQGALRRFQAGLPPVLRTNRTFRRYWLSQIVSLTGTWMQQVAQGWVVLTLTSSALAIGAVSIVGSLPMLLLTLTGGVVADRYDKRQILIGTQTVLGLLAGVFALLVATDAITYWQIVLLAILLGITAAFEMPASQAFIPELVDRDEMQEAIALNSAAFNGSRLIGPAMAGLLIAVVGVAAAFAANALSFLAVIGVLLSMRGRAVARHGVPGNVGSAMREGLVYVRARPVLIGLIGITGLTSLLVFPNLAVLMPLYVTEVLGVGPAWLGIMMSCSGGGSLVGSLALLRGQRTVADAKRRIRMSAIGVTIGLLGLAAARSPILAMPAVIVLSFSLSLGMAQIATRVQELAPDAMRGRVMSIHGLAFTGVMPFAVLLVSATAEGIGQPATLLSAAVAYALLAVILYALFVRRDEPLPEPETQAAPGLADAA